MIHPGGPGPRVGPSALKPGGSLHAPGTVLSAPTCTRAFNPVSSPNGAKNNYLYATAAVSANDVWAVGVSNIGTNAYDQPLAEHWNGTSWSIVATPNPGAYWADLNAVTAIASNNVWAVGDYRYDLAGHFHTFAEHWDGSKWTVTTSTQNPTPFSTLFAVDAVSSNDIWAAGIFNSAGWFTLVEHWNGTAWTVSPSVDHVGSGNAFENNFLFGVSALNSTDVWIGGYFGNVDTGVDDSLAEHWDGASWSIVSTPDENGGGIIAFVNALEPGHAVAVGGAAITSGNPTVGEAWDLLAAGGSTKSTQTGPGAGNNYLEGVDRSGAGVWVVGYTSDVSNTPSTLVVPATWNASSHTLTWGSPGTSANPSASNNVLNAVAAVSPYTFWAVGYQTNVSANVDQTLAENYCALNFTTTAPTSVQGGSSFSVIVSAKNGSGATATGYAGTVHFTSTDAHATLPADYTFVPGTDAGSHTFTGVKLATPCSQSITVSDLAMPLTVPATATIGVVVGPCQAPASTPGAASTNQAPPGVPGGRAVNQSGSGSPGPRLPNRAGVSPSAGDAVAAGSSMSATSNSSMSTAKPAAPAQQSVATGVAAVPARIMGSNVPSPTEIAPTATLTMAASRDAPPAPPPASPPWQLPVGLLTALALALIAVGRRRSKEVSHAQVGS